MSSRPLLRPQAVITDGNMASATVTSLVTIIQQISMPCYTVSWSGSTPIGVVSVEVSNDYTQNADGSVRNSGTWTALPATGAVSGNTGTGTVDFSTGAYACRLKYTKTSGTGTIQAVIAGKVG